MEPEYSEEEISLRKKGYSWRDIVLGKVTAELLPWEEIYQNLGAYNLSDRALRVCRENFLTDLNKIIDYYFEHETFERLLGCGKTTEIELTKLCVLYFHSVSERCRRCDYYLRSFETATPRTIGRT
jgi:hypothetical protein